MVNESMAIEGTLDLFQLPEILQLVSHQAKTGILTVQGDSDIVAISFERGRVVAADALNQTLEESLGEVLAGQGMVAPAEFAALAAEHRAGKGRLMDLLVARRLVERGQLLEALRLHMYRMLVELLRWRSGEFKFYSTEEVSYEEGFPPIAVEELLIRSVEEAAGEGHPTIPDSRSVYEPVDPGRPIRVRREGEENLDGGDAIWLSAADQELLDRLGSGHTVSALVKKTGSDEYKVRYLLHRLLEAGVVRPRSPAVLMPEVPPSYAAPIMVEADRLEETLHGTPVVLPPPPRTDTARTVTLVRPWPGRLLAAIPLLVAGLVLWRSPLSLPLPFPWQAAQHTSITQALLGSTYLRLDQAAKAFFLLEGHFPPALQDLARRGFLASSELRDPLGRPLVWAAHGSTYDVAPVEGGVSLAEQGATEAVTGNFLLDPEFLQVARTDRKPLVLLD